MIPPIAGTNGSQYGARLQHNNAGTTFSAWSMTLEKKDIFHTIGKHLTLSFYAKKGSAFTGDMLVQIVARTDTEDKINSGTNVTISNNNIASSLTTSWQKFTFTTTSVVPTTEVVGLNFWHNNTSGTDANNYFDLSQVQLEVGDTATDFEHLRYGEQLSHCQRYYNRLGLFYMRVRNESASSQNPDFGTTLFFPPMRDVPTINTYTDANYTSSGTTTTGGAVLTISNITISSATGVVNSNSSGVQNVGGSAYLELDKEI